MSHPLEQFFHSTFNLLWAETHSSTPLSHYSNFMLTFNARILDVFNNSREAVKYLIFFMLENFYAFSQEEDSRRSDEHFFMAKLRQEQRVSHRSNSASL